MGQSSKTTKSKGAASAQAAGKAHEDAIASDPKISERAFFLIVLESVFFNMACDCDSDSGKTPSPHAKSGLKCGNHSTLNRQELRRQNLEFRKDRMTIPMVELKQPSHSKRPALSSKDSGCHADRTLVLIK